MTTPEKPPARPRLRIVGGLGLLVGLAGLGLGAATLAFPGLRTIMAEPADTPTSLKPAPVDGGRAFGYLNAICAMGPHPAGSPANAKVRQFVADHFKKLGGAVREQPFAGKDPVSNADLAMANLVGSWFPDRAERIMLCAHYDSRPFPDEDPNPEKRKQPFIGANDPASGIAMLMELAHHLKDSPTPWGVDLVLFDTEELVYGGGADQTGEYFLGSKHFASTYTKDRREKKSKDRYEAAILFDLIAGKDLALPRDPYSMEFAPSLVNDVWRVAQALKVTQFRSEYGPQVTDDHLPLNNVGIPAIDIIDFHYPHWHKAADLPENCSPASLATVGKVVTAWMNKPKPRKR